MLANAPSGHDFDHPYPHLRTPGEIQGFGVLLALHPATLRILSASENVGGELGVPHAGLIGRSLAELIAAPEAMAEIRSCLEAPEPVFDNALPVQIGGRRFDLILHARDGVLIAELERLAPGAPTRADMDRLGDGAIVGMMAPDSYEELIAAAPRAIRDATDFDRVLLYRFDDANRGQVIGEARRDGVESFMGLYFPEADIPTQARQLYTQNFARYIPQVGAANSRIVPAENPLTNLPLDLSLTGLRSVAPCHVEYLGNMGVAASMSFSVVSNGRLWGLFACHHYRPSQLSHTQRRVCEQIAMLFVAKLEDLINPASVQDEMAARRAAVLATSPLCHGALLRHDWTPEQERALLGLVNAEGAAIYVDGEIGEIGLCPDIAELHAYMQREPDAFDRLLRMYDEDGLFHTSSIAGVLPFGATMRTRGSGLLVVPLSRARREYLLWFRPEQVVKATWAGNPGETAVKDMNARFSPRRSFAAWRQDIRDRSEPWTPLEIANALALRDRVVAAAG